MGAKTVVTVVVKLFLTFAFVMAAAVKLTPKVNPEVHEEMVKNFVKFAPLFWADKLGYNADQLRVFVGTLEGISALLLWVVPLAGTFILDVLMIGAAYTHVMLNEYDMIVPSAVLGSLCALLFLLSIPSAPAAAPKPVEADKGKTE